MMENGWWWGCVLGERVDPEEAFTGYLPSNYVQQLRPKPQQTVKKSKLDEIEDP